MKSGPQAKVINQPHGVVLILGSQKSDLGTLLKPLVSSIAAGNYNILKPNIGNDDIFVTETDKIVTKMLKESLDPNRTLILEDGYDYMNLIEDHKVDLVFTRKNKSLDIVKACGDVGVKVK